MDDKKYTEELVKSIGKKLRGKQAALRFDNTPTEGSVNPVTSEGIKDYVDNHSGTTYIAGENITIKDNVISATGKNYEAGENITITDNIISAKDTTYDAGKDIDIVDNEISFNGISILESYTSSWAEHTLTGLSNFNKENVWTDGNNTYYSYNSNQYILDEDKSTWITKYWSMNKPDYGKNIWTDGKNIYCSSGSTNGLIFDVENDAWVRETWNNSWGDIYGNRIWTDGNNVYYSNSSIQKVLDKSTWTWIDKTWLSFKPVDRSAIWSDGNNIYYSNSNNQYIFDKENCDWILKIWNGQRPIYASRIWSDGENIYYSDSTHQYVLNKETSTWVSKTNWNGLSSFYGYTILKTNNNIYCYLNNNEQYALNKITNKTHLLHKVSETGNYNDLKNKPTYVSGNGIKFKTNTDGNISINTTYIGGKDIQIEGNVISNTSLPTVTPVNKMEEWETDNWIFPSGLGGIAIDKIWTCDNRIYYTKDWNHTYFLNPTTKTWVLSGVKFDTYYTNGGFWTDGTNIYYSYYDFNSSDDNLVFNKSTETWSVITFKNSSGTVVYINGKYVWTDGKNVYYDGPAVIGFTSQTTMVHWKLDKTQRVWSNNSWNGLSSAQLSNFYGSSVWTDGNNIYTLYISNNANLSHVLNKETSTWTTVEWTWPSISGVTYSPSGSNVWTDGSNIYYSFSVYNSSTSTYNSYSFMLDKQNNEWVVLDWNIPTSLSLSGGSILSDGRDIYCLQSGSQYLIKNKKGRSVQPKIGDDIFTDAAPNNSLILTNVSILETDWISSTVYNEYPYEYTVPCGGMKATTVVEVIFNVDEAISGNYAPVCNSKVNGLTVYSKVNDAIVIPIIKEV